MHGSSSDLQTLAHFTPPYGVVLCRPHMLVQSSQSSQSSSLWKVRIPFARVIDITVKLCLSFVIDGLHLTGRDAAGCYGSI